MKKIFLTIRCTVISILSQHRSQPTMVKISLFPESLISSYISSSPIWPQDIPAFVGLEATGVHLTAKSSAFQAQSPHSSQERSEGWWSQGGAMILSNFWKLEESDLLPLLPSFHAPHSLLPHCQHTLP